jgi:hypothetical protein
LSAAFESTPLEFVIPTLGIATIIDEKVPSGKHGEMSIFYHNERLLV